MNPHIRKQNPLFNQNSSMNTKAGAAFRVSREYLTITLIDPYPHIPFPYTKTRAIFRFLVFFTLTFTNYIPF